MRHSGFLKKLKVKNSKMGDVEETTHRPALNGATRSYIVTAGVCFSIVGLLLLGYAQEDAAKKAKEALPAATSQAAVNSEPANPDDPVSRNKKVGDLARKSKGKFDALDKSDKDYLNGLSSGHGKQLLEMRWQTLNNASTNPTSQQPDPEAKIREVVERTKGDFSKVTAAEKSHMNDFTNGHGQQYFETRVQKWKDSLQAKTKKEPEKSSAPAVAPE